VRRRRSSPDPDAVRVQGAATAAVAIALLVVAAGPAPAVGAAETTALSEPSPWTALDPESGQRLPVLVGARLEHVVFLATWCPACRDELPALVDLAARWQDDGYVVTLVIVRNRYDRDDAIAFARAAREAGRVLVDTDDTVRAAFAVREIPTHVVLDGEGVEIARGPTLAEGIADVVEREMRERP